MAYVEILVPPLFVATQMGRGIGGCALQAAFECGPRSEDGGPDLWGFWGRGEIGAVLPWGRERSRFYNAAQLTNH